MNNPTLPKALVTVFEDLQTARDIVEELKKSGIAAEKIELVTKDVAIEAPEIETPDIRESTATSMLDGSWRGAAFGAATGLLAMIFAPVPLALGASMVAMGGMVGGAYGGIAGILHASEDESVDLPTLKEYQQLVDEGNSLVVVLGDHSEVMTAEQIVNSFPDIHSHLHRWHGHDAHEHPSRKSR